MTGRRDLLHDARGATAVEYGLIVGIIVLGMFGSLQLFANTSVTMWNNITNQVTAVTPS